MSAGGGNPRTSIGTGKRDKHIIRPERVSVRGRLFIQYLCPEADTSYVFFKQLLIQYLGFYLPLCQVNEYLTELPPLPL